MILFLDELMKLSLTGLEALQFSKHDTVWKYKGGTGKDNAASA